MILVIEGIDDLQTFIDDLDDSLSGRRQFFDIMDAFSKSGLRYMRSITPVRSGALRDSERVENLGVIGALSTRLKFKLSIDPNARGPRGSKPYVYGVIVNRMGGHRAFMNRTLTWMERNAESRVLSNLASTIGSL